jgi:spore coat polysaccharide biosynthesis protein SpsF
MGSSRLPGKAMIDICGKPALQRVFERVQGAKRIHDIVVATSVNSQDDCIAQLCERLGCSYFRGSEEDVLKRVLEAARKFELDVICEVTADCLLLDHNHIDVIVNIFLNGDYDHVSNIIENEEFPRTFPRGYDIRVFSRDALERTNKEVDNSVDRSHCSTWMYRNPKGKLKYKYTNYNAPEGQNRPDLEITLDTESDLELIRFIYGFETQGYNQELTCEQVISIIDNYPMMYKKVAEIKRKNYFLELEECYAKQKNIEGAKKNEKVSNSNNRSRKTGNGNRTRKKSK